VKKTVKSNTAAIPGVAVLSVSPIEEDHESLESIFNQSGWSAYTESRWTLHRSKTLKSALNVLAEGKIPIVLCERDLLPGTWRDLLEQISLSPKPPFLIVTSRLADCHLWAEALNLGAYDVLAKPFDTDEVVHSVSLAWLQWRAQRAAASKVPEARSAPDSSRPGHVPVSPAPRSLDLPGHEVLPSRFFRNPMSTC